MYVCIRIGMYVCMSVCMYVCMHVHAMGIYILYVYICMYV